MTLLLNSLIFSFREYFFDRHTGFSRLKAPLACPILDCTSFSLDPVRSTVLPRYLKSTTCSTVLSPHFKPSGESLVAMLFVLSELIFSPKRLAFSRITSRRSWSLSLFASIRVMSSAKSRSASHLLSQIWIPNPVQSRST